MSAGNLYISLMLRKDKRKRHIHSLIVYIQIACTHETVKATNRKK